MTQPHKLYYSTYLLATLMCLAGAFLVYATYYAAHAALLYVIDSAPPTITIDLRDWGCTEHHLIPTTGTNTLTMVCDRYDRRPAGQ